MSNIVLDDIFDIEDYLDELEEKVPEIHSGTLRIEELSDINTRAAHLVPGYQPTTTGISLQNLIDIKANTIAKDYDIDFNYIFTSIEVDDPLITIDLESRTLAGITEYFESLDSETVTYITSYLSESYSDKEYRFILRTKNDTLYGRCISVADNECNMYFDFVSIALSVITDAETGDPIVVVTEITPEPEPEEDIVIKFLYANPWCLGFDKEFEPNPEYWTDTTESGDKWHSWIPKDTNISYTYAGHKFTGEDVPIYWEDGASIFEIEIEPDAIEREEIEDSIIKLPINISFPEGAFINGDKKTKAVNYSFNFTDDLNGGDYPLKSQTIDTSDPTVTVEEDYNCTTYGLPSSSRFNEEYWESIYELIENEVFTTIILNASGDSKTYYINPEGGSTGVAAGLVDGKEDIERGQISCIGGDQSSKGFIIIINKETEPR